MEWMFKDCSFGFSSLVFLHSLLPTLLLARSLLPSSLLASVFTLALLIFSSEKQNPFRTAEAQALPFLPACPPLDCCTAPCMVLCFCCIWTLPLQHTVLSSVFQNIHQISVFERLRVSLWATMALSHSVSYSFPSTLEPHAHMPMYKVMQHVLFYILLFWLVELY